MHRRRGRKRIAALVAIVSGYAVAFLPVARAEATRPPAVGLEMVGADGGVFAFGPQASFHGSLANTANKLSPIVGGAQVGQGYVLVSSNGTAYAMGSAPFLGDLGNTHLSAPIVGIASAGSTGYWMVGADGGVFAFGSAPYEGSLGSRRT
jgi:hypothetical protein